MPTKDNQDGPILDAARLSRSFSEICQILDRAVGASAVFCAGHQVGFSTSQGVNPYLYIRDVSANECVVCCYGCSCLWKAPYTIASDDTVTFGKAVKVKEEFVAVDGEAITDAVAVADDEVEILDSGAGLPRLRLLSTKANTVINQRAYAMAALRAGVADLKKRIATGLVYAEAPHPKPILQDGKVAGYQSNPAKRASRLVDVSINDQGEVRVTHEFMDTPLGKDVCESFVKRTGKYGTSTRAIGRNKTQLPGRNVPLYGEMVLDTFDFVQNPALGETLTSFEVLLDSELPANEPAPSPAPQVPPAAGQGGDSLTDAGSPAKEEPLEKTTPAGQTAPAVTPTPIVPAATVPAAPSLTAEQVSALETAAAIINADKARRESEAARADVTAYVASPEVTSALAPFADDLRAPIVQRVAAAPSRAEAERVLGEQIDLTSRIVAAAKLQAVGYGQPGAGTGVTTPTAGQTDVRVVGNPTPHREVIKRYTQAHDAHALRVANHIPDPSLRAVNQKFIDEIAASLEQKHGARVVESAEAILDSKEGWDILTDATATTNLWNQPTLLMTLITLAYQDLTMMQYCTGVGPNATEWEKANINGQIGSVLRVPTEVFVAPSGSLDLPNYDNYLASAENVGVALGSLQASWQTFFPSWAKIAIEITKEAQKAMENGPLQYDVMARLTYHMVAEMARRKDSRIAAEMTQIADEFGAVAVASEGVLVGNLIQNTSGTKLYGANVTWYANLIGAGTSGAPNRNPIVRKRTVGALSSAGQFSTSTNYAVTCTGASTTQVEGYLDAAGQIQNYPGTTATFAVDFNNGRVCFNAGSAIDGTHLPTVNYTYVTNYDTFSLTVPNGVEPAYYYNRLLTQVDQTAAVMGSNPRFMRPNLCLGSLTAMTYVENAQIFYKLAQPDGTRLVASTRDSVAERGGIAYQKHNNPWAVGDSRLLLTRLGATKVAVDSPIEVEGPYATQEQSTGLHKTNKTMYATENAVVCTAQAVDQSGNVKNPVGRSIIFR